jgi:hypothetical protein
MWINRRQRHTAIRAELTTPGEIPAAVASAEMFWTKVWKSPPQRAAKVGVERLVKRTRKYRKEICADFFPTFRPGELIFARRDNARPSIGPYWSSTSANKPLLCGKSD